MANFDVFFDSNEVMKEKYSSNGLRIAAVAAIIGMAAIYIMIKLSSPNIPLQEEIKNIMHGGGTKKIQYERQKHHIDSSHESENGRPVMGRQITFSRPISLEKSFQRLASNADAGNRNAACVLARSLAICVEEIKNKKRDEALINLAARANPGSKAESVLIKLIAAVSSEQGSEQAMCDGLPLEYLKQKDARMLQAARLGDRFAMTSFALQSKTSDMQDGIGKDFDIIYRTHAVEMLERSASMGDGLALRELFMVYLYGVSPNRSEKVVMSADPAAALAINAALVQVLGAKEGVHMSSLLKSKGISIESVDLIRYQNLQKKYREYAEKISIRMFSNNHEESIDSCLDMQSLFQNLDMKKSTENIRI